MSKLLRKLAKSIVPAPSVITPPPRSMAEAVPLDKLDIDLAGDMEIAKALAWPTLPAAAAIGTTTYQLKRHAAYKERLKEEERQARIAEGGEVISPGDIGMAEFARRYPYGVRRGERQPAGLLENIMMH